MTCERSVTKFL